MALIKSLYEGANYVLKLMIELLSEKIRKDS